MAGQHSAGRHKNRGNHSDLPEKVLQHIMTVSDSEFSGISASGLAYSFNVERTKLSRHFKRYCGMTLEDFLFKQKMTRAAYMLIARKGITVKEVSETIGFCTSDYFIRKFKQFYGLAPGKYKELKTIIKEN